MSASNESVPPSLPPPAEEGAAGWHTAWRRDAEGASRTAPGQRWEESDSYPTGGQEAPHSTSVWATTDADRGRERAAAARRGGTGSRISSREPEAAISMNADDGAFETLVERNARRFLSEMSRFVRKSRPRR